MTQPQPIRVVMADDHELLRDGFRVLLRKQSEVLLVGEAADGEALLTLCRSLQPDVIITDIKMPVMDGITATRQLVQEFPQSGVIAFSMYEEESLVVDMLEAGASGYLLKNADKAEMLTAIKAVYNKQTYYCQATSVKLAQIIAQRGYHPIKRRKEAVFSLREQEVIRLICQERTNKEIADALHLSIRTIESHREHILQKMDVKNTAGIVIYAIRHGLYQV